VRAPAARWATAFVFFPAIAVASSIRSVAAPEKGQGFDTATFWAAGHAVVHGDSPYPNLSSLPAHAGPLFAPFVYPPVTAFELAPLSALPYDVAKLIFALASIGAIALALGLLGVRDWRCYAAVFSAAPVYAAVVIGTISPLLLLGAAAAWRYRHRAVVLGLLVAYLVTAKLFLWPLWLWLVATRRFRAAAVSAVAGVAAVAVSWAAIGFAGLRDYPALLQRLSGLTGVHSYSLYALGAGRIVPFLTVVAVVVAAVLLHDDVRLFVVALGIALLATPILWPHYLVLLLVPLALVRPSFSVAWLAPLVLWADCAAWSNSAPRTGVLLLLVAAGLGWTLTRRSGRAERVSLSRGAEIRTRELQSPRLAR